jgi:hypothetical protein
MCATAKSLAAAGAITAYILCSPWRIDHDATRTLRGERERHVQIALASA